MDARLVALDARKAFRAEALIPLLYLSQKVCAQSQGFVHSELGRETLGMEGHELVGYHKAQQGPQCAAARGRVTEVDKGNRDLQETHLIYRTIDVCNYVNTVGRISSTTVGFCSGVHSALMEENEEM